MHRGHDQNRHGRLGMQQNSLMRHGLRAQGVLGGLDDGVFEGVVVVGWIGDYLQHGFVPFDGAATGLLSNR